MDAQTKALVGSPHRDAFKNWHKGLDRAFYACDLDFVLVDKYPPRIIAAIDYKKPAERVTFSEILAYNHLAEAGIPVYLVSTAPLMPPYAALTVYQYLGGDWHPNPPTYQLEMILDGVSVAAFEQWQNKLRKRR